MIKNIKKGDMIDENLIVLDILGGDECDIEDKTGCGVVYIILDTKDNHILALKTFQDRFINDEEVYDDFKIESLECVKLKYHPNVVFSIGVQMIDNRPFLAMEPVLPNEEGRQSLKDYLGEKLSAEQKIDWLIQICHGMEYINSQGIKSHGDIKPENILIDFLNRAKISDFGFLELFNQDSENLRGTPAYMAPEAFDKTHNIKTDIYSLGIVIYQLFNKGKLPFYAENNFFEEWKELHKTKKIPNTENTDINPIIKKCLEKSPENRYETFKELRGDLESIFTRISKKDAYAPEIDEISDYLHNLTIAHSYGQYGNIELFRKYSHNLSNSGNNTVLLEYGIDLIHLNEYQKAINVFNKILGRLDDEDFQMDRLYFNLGHAYHELHRLYDAENYYYECLSENENYNKAKVNLGNIYREIGNYGTSLDFYDEVLDENPNFYEALYNKAILLGNMKKYDEAEQLFDEIKCLKDNEKVFYDKALMYYNTNNMLSLLELSNIEIIDENDAQALFFMIMIYIDDKQPELAKEKYENLIQISDDLEYKLTVASKYYKNGYIEESMKIFDKLKRSDDLTEKYESILAYSRLICTENITKSMDLMDMILKSNAPKRLKSKAYVNKFLFMGKTNQAKKNLDNALRLYNKNEAAHLNYISYYADKKKWKKALKRIKYGLKLIPNSQEMYFLKGKIYSDLNETDLAIEYLEKSLELDSPQIKTYVLLCLLYSLKEDMENMSKYLYYAMNLDGQYNYFEENDFEKILKELVDKYLIE